MTSREKQYNPYSSFLIFATCQYTFEVSCYFVQQFLIDMATAKLNIFCVILAFTGCRTLVYSYVINK